MDMTHKRILIVLFSSAALLTACGGGDTPAPPLPPAPTDAVPASASASTAGLMTYLTDLSATPIEDKEPVDLSRFAPPMSEDAEPESIS
jgi:hypothetical protein